jgi:hypothetical protein
MVQPELDNGHATATRRGVIGEERGHGECLGRVRTRLQELTIIKYFVDTFNKGKHLMDGRELDTATA